MSIYKRTASSYIFDVVLYSLFLLFAVLCIYPFWYMLVYSISDPSKAAAGVRLLPKGLSLTNYVQVLKLRGFGNSFLVSLARTVLGTLLSLFCNSLLGYLFSRTEMPLRKILYRALVITMYVSGGMIPTFLIYKNYGLLNNFLVYIVPGAVSAYNVILVKTFIEQLPASLEESAMIDGAGYFTIYWKIIMPLCTPIIATIAVFCAIGQWNSWFDNYIYVSNETLRTLQLTLYNFLNESQRIAKLLTEAKTADQMQALAQTQITPRGVQITTTMITTIPIILVYPYMQRYFVKGIMVGAIKG